MSHRTQLPQSELFDDRIVRSAPVPLRIIHHDVDEDRQQPVNDGRSVAHLAAIDLAVPGSAAVQKLVSKDIKSIEQDREDPRCILSGKGGIDRLAARNE